MLHSDNTPKSALATGSASGNAISEYVVVGSLVLLACMASLELLGGSINQSLQGFQDGLKRKPSALQASNTASGLKNQDAGTLLNFKTRSGITLQLQDYPQNLSQAIVTAGSNGTTQIILGNLEKIIGQLRQSGELNQEQANLLSDLANQGHKIAEIEAAVEAAHARATSRDSFLNTPISYQGQQYTARQLVTQIGIMDLDELTAGGETQKFEAIQAQAEASGALNDPVVKQVITVMSKQIIALANGLESGEANIELHNAPLNQLFGQYAIDRMNSESPVPTNLTDLASSITHQDSGTICTTGGSTDSGTACAP